MATDPQVSPLVKVGEHDLTPYLNNLSTTASVNAIGTSSVNLAAGVIAERTLDYTGSFRVSAMVPPDIADQIGPHLLIPQDSPDQSAQRERPLFTGVVAEAAPTPEGLTLRGQDTSALLQETLIGSYWTSGIAAAEQIFILARAGGFPAARLNLEGLDELVPEEFEVVMPIDGVAITKVLRVGSVMFFPSTIRARAVSLVTSDKKAHELWNAKAYAATNISHQLGYEAEQEGVARIETALAWLTAVSHDARAAIDGRLVQFHRSQLFFTPQARDFVVVLGATGRRYARTRRISPVSTALAVEELLDRVSASLPVNMDQSDVHALMAWRRSRLAPDAVSSTLALFEAIEFYAGKTKIEKTFDKSDVTSVRRAIKDANLPLSEAQFKRLEQVCSKLNDPPLALKLRKTLADESVPYDESDFATLWSLREVRNDAVHGRGVDDSGTLDKLRQAHSFVARMLICRITNRRFTT